jgi:hypothetical protein
MTSAAAAVAAVFLSIVTIVRENRREAGEIRAIAGLLAAELDAGSSWIELHLSMYTGTAAPEMAQTDLFRLPNLAASALGPKVGLLPKDVASAAVAVYRRYDILQELYERRAVSAEDYRRAKAGHIPNPDPVPYETANVQYFTHLQWTANAARKVLPALNALAAGKSSAVASALVAQEARRDEELPGRRRVEGPSALN